jgi:hypothetical protein
MKLKLLATATAVASFPINAGGQRAPLDKFRQTVTITKRMRQGIPG